MLYNEGFNTYKKSKNVIKVKLSDDLLDQITDQERLLL